MEKTKDFSDKLVELMAKDFWHQFYVVAPCEIAKRMKKKWKSKKLNSSM